MLRTHTIAAYPTAQQAWILQRWLWLSRRLFNKALAKRKRHYAKTGKSLTYYDQATWLTRLRKRCPSLAEMPRWFQMDSLHRLDKAMKAFFSRLKKGQKPGYPRFKGRDRWNSMEYLHTGNYIAGNKIRIPILGLVAARNVRLFEGRIKAIRVLQRIRGWRVQLIVDDGREPPKPRRVQSATGVDVGLTSFATFANGQRIPNPRFARKFAKKIRRASRSLARRKRGSNRRRQAKQRLASLHERLTDARKNFTHQVSRHLVNTHDLVVFEKLSIRNMTRSRLAKHILDAAWGQLVRQVAYKAESAGSRFVQVPAAGTSRDCSVCGASVPKTLSVRRHRCACGADLDRDHNAARNILARGCKQLGQVLPKVTRGERPPASLSFR